VTSDFSVAFDTWVEVPLELGGLWVGAALLPLVDEG
jgi:hypothetical protein